MIKGIQMEMLRQLHRRQARILNYARLIHFTAFEQSQYVHCA